MAAGGRRGGGGARAEPRRLQLQPGQGVGLVDIDERQLGDERVAGSSATDVPDNVPNQVSVRKDVAVQNCAATAGGWSAGGTVQNTLGHDATYHIDVFFTSAQATDLAYGVTAVAVDSGQTKLWSVRATFAAPAQVLCVLRGVSTS